METITIRESQLLKEEIGCGKFLGRGCTIWASPMHPMEGEYMEHEEDNPFGKKGECFCGFGGFKNVNPSGVRRNRNTSSIRESQLLTEREAPCNDGYTHACKSCIDSYDDKEIIAVSDENVNTGINCSCFGECEDESIGTTPGKDVTQVRGTELRELRELDFRRVIKKVINERPTICERYGKEHHFCKRCCTCIGEGGIVDCGDCEGVKPFEGSCSLPLDRFGGVKGGNGNWDMEDYENDY